MQPCLPKELVEIYSTPTPKGWCKPKSKGTCLVDQWEMSITIAGVHYLYSGLDYESWSNKTDHKTLEKKKQFPNLKITWTPSFPFCGVRHVFPYPEQRHSCCWSLLEMRLLPKSNWLCSIVLDQPILLSPRLLLAHFELWGLMQRTKFRCQQHGTLTIIEIYFGT